MTLRIISEPAIEPITIAEVMVWSSIDASGQEPAPGSITVALAGLGAGNVNSGAHRYLATFVTSNGETQAGSVSASVTTTGGDGQVALTAIPLGGALVISRKLYRTAADGSTYLLLATLSDNTTTVYADNIADSSLGAAAPSVNTTTDPKLAMLISAARKVAESFTGRGLITQTWERVYDKFPAKEMQIGKLPIQSVTSIKYYDTAGNLQTLGPTAYVLDADTMPGWVLPAYGLTWPETLEIAQAVIIRFVAGYGNTGLSVPPEIRMWISAQVKAAYDNPSALMDGKYVCLDFLDGLLYPYRIIL